MADRVEREIEEILRKIDDIKPGKQPRKPRLQPSTPRPAPRPRESRLAHTLAGISLYKVMIWSLFAALVLFVARGVPGSSWLLIGALIVFVTAFILSRLANNAGPRVEKRWRGEVLDLSAPSWPERLKSWFKGGKRY